MKKFHKGIKIPLNPPFPKGETPISLPFVKGGAAVQSQTMAPDGGEGLFLFQKAKFIRKYEFRNSCLTAGRCDPNSAI
jgi:hypothetical protein